MDKNTYYSLKSKVLAMKASAMLCLNDGNQTEGYTLNVNSFGEDDWE